MGLRSTTPPRFAANCGRTTTIEAACAEGALECGREAAAFLLPARSLGTVLSVGIHVGRIRRMRGRAVEITSIMWSSQLTPTCCRGPGYSGLAKVECETNSKKLDFEYKRIRRPSDTSSGVSGPTYDSFLTEYAT